MLEGLVDEARIKERLVAEVLVDQLAALVREVRDHRRLVVDLETVLDRPAPGPINHALSADRGMCVDTSGRRACSFPAGAPAPCTRCQASPPGRRT
jgi:hypothetical protein